MNTRQAEIYCFGCDIIVTADNIGITMSKDTHICKDCLKTEYGEKLTEGYLGLRRIKSKTEQFLCQDCGHVHGGER